MRDQTQTENAPSGAVESRRFMVIFNPVAGHRRRRYLQRVLDRLTELGCRYVLKETTCRGDAERFCAMLQPGDCDAVLVAGGDGTINEVVNGLADKKLPLAVRAEAAKVAAVKEATAMATSATTPSSAPRSI